MIVVPIVEGHGEVSAVPELLRRLNAWIAPNSYVAVNPPIRTNKSKFLNDEDELGRKLQLARLKAQDDGWVLVLLDADDECPVALSGLVMKLASKFIPTSNLSIVVANREFEAWFIGACESLEGCRGFTRNPNTPFPSPESPRDAKGWMDRQMTDGYHEVTDQVAFCAKMDLNRAWQRCRSFQKLAAEYARNVPNLI